MAHERRIDPEDGKAYTYDELTSYYKCKYKRKAIDGYWANTCTPVKAQCKLKANAKAPEQIFDSVVSQAAKRLGKIAVASRFHRDRALGDDYLVEAHVLGGGYNGSVYKASSRAECGTTYAVKDFDLQNISAKKMDEIEGECRSFLSMDHPHVARLVDVYQVRNKLSLVMECNEGGEVMERLLEKEQFSEEQAANTIHQMLLAMNYVHGRGLVHGDIKPENFMYEKEGSDHVMLIDFGSSKIFDASLRANPSASHLGTLDYAAPEVFTSGCYTDKSDMWSLGVTAFMLLTGYMPFSDEDGEEAMKRSMKKGEFTVQDSWDQLSSAAADFVRKLLTVDPVRRLSAQEALRHEFIVKHRSLAAAVGALVDAHTVDSLYTFSLASKFQRACMSVMAWSMASGDRALLRQSFLAMDKTKRGTINLLDFKACMEEHLELTDDEIKDVFVTLDASQTGVIHYTEFLAAMMASRVPLHDSLLRATFHRFDMRNTGFIEVDDLRKMLNESFEGEDFALQLKEADSNEDGKISYKEFVEFVTESVMQLKSKDSSIGGS